MKKHKYNIKVEWQGNLGTGTDTYKSYSRNHSILSNNKYSEILGSSDPSFLGDTSLYNPEELFLSTIASCHMLWYLHLCSQNQIIVLSYEDTIEGVMEESANGSGRFISATLFPKVNIKESNKLDLAKKLHLQAHEMCFIANSCNFQISHIPEITVK